MKQQLHTSNQPVELESTSIAIMTITEAVKSAVGLGGSSSARKDPGIGQLAQLTLAVAASREAMSEAKLPLAYRDSCANLLIPLNRCRYEEYYLPWKCEVSSRMSGDARDH